MVFNLPKFGDTKSVRIFAVFPIVFKGTVHWLELLQIDKVYRCDKWEIYNVKRIKLGEHTN